MVIDTGGPWWRGTEAADLDEYLREFSADGYPVGSVVHASCAHCGSDRFALLADDEAGCGGRRCASCGDLHWMLDSAEYLEEAELEEAQCPCGGELFEPAVGFALRDTGEVRWVYVALRCVADGVLGVYADWKIDYSPTDHLPAAV